MREDRKLTDLIGNIYDTTLDHKSWTGVLMSITDFVGAQAGGLVSKDPVSKFATSPYNFGVDPHYVQLYEQTYSEFDPLPALQRLGQIASVPDLVPYDVFRKERFSQEWLLPQSWVDAGMAVLEKSGPNCTIVLTFLRNKAGGMVDEKMRRCIALIVPHVRRALLIGKAIEQKQSEAANFADTLNSLSAATFLVDALGRIVHANAAGRDMLYANDFVRSAGGRLAARDAQVNHAFRVIFAAAAKGDAETGAKAIALSLMAHDGERYVAHVLPLKSGARRATGITYTAVAAVFVRKAALGSSLDAIGQTYKLTPAELRVLRAIVDVGGVPETAAALGVAETTVKTHLYRLFDKTDASRQADLVKLVAGFSNPLVY
jgi:DNA-binding CsgD family transcriptional regulator/PAS domain-containing protein